MRRSRTKASAVACAAVFGALSLALLYVGDLVPAGRWGVAALAGLMPAGAIISAGMFSGVLCWLGVTVLAFLLIPDKLAVLLFGVLFGLYPIVKSLVERRRCRLLEIGLKLAFFNVTFTAVYLAMKAAVLASLPTALHAVWVLYLAGNVVFLVYDHGFSKLIALYVARVYKASR